MADSTQSSELSEPALDAVTTCVTYVCRVLLSVLPVAKRARVQVGADGVNVSVENARVTQAHLQLSRPLFTTYNFGHSTGTPDVYMFGISLDRLVECFQMFGNDLQDSFLHRSRGKSNPTESVYDSGKSLVGGTSVAKLRYDEPGAQFVLMLDDGGVTTTCEFMTSTTDDDMTDITLEADAICTRVIMKAGYLTDAFRELDSAGSDTLTVRSTSDPPQLTFVCRGDVGSVECAFSRDRNTVDTFFSDHAVQNVYNFKMVGMARDAIKLASKISLRTDHSGVMSIQCMCDVGDGRQSFIDFRFLPVYDEYDLSRTQPSRARLDSSDPESDSSD